jgi:hypothetical protein
MSGFLEGLVRRGAGLGAAPGEQTATLRPLSRFEQRPFDGAEGASPALPESESVVPAATRQHAGHESVPVQQRETPLHSPAAPVVAPGEHPSPAPAPVTTQHPAIATTAGEPEDVARAQASLPTAPVQPPPAQTPAARMPAAETLATPAPAGPQAQVTHENTRDITHEVTHAITHAVTRREEVTHFAPAAPLPRDAATSHPPHPAPETRLPGEEPDVPVSHAAMVPAAPDQSPRAIAPPSAPRQHESHDPPAPQTSITIGRIEIDFGQKPAAPPAPPRPQRTRGFAAYARARRGQAR